MLTISLSYSLLAVTGTLIFSFPQKPGKRPRGFIPWPSCCQVIFRSGVLMTANGLLTGWRAFCLLCIHCADNYCLLFFTLSYGHLDLLIHLQVGEAPRRLFSRPERCQVSLGQMPRPLCLHQLSWLDGGDRLKKVHVLWLRSAHFFARLLLMIDAGFLGSIAVVLIWPSHCRPPWWYNCAGWNCWSFISWLSCRTAGSFMEVFLWRFDGPLGRLLTIGRFSIIVITVLI